jgi:hypothetical protein
MREFNEKADHLVMKRLSARRDPKSADDKQQLLCGIGVAGLTERPADFLYEVTFLRST